MPIARGFVQRPCFLPMISPSHSLFALCLFLVGAFVVRAEPSFKTPVSYEEATRRADELLAKMTVQQKIELISGHHSFYTKGFPELGIPSFYMSDATMGVHIRPNISGSLAKSTAFPASIGMAATWDPRLIGEVGRSIGEEARAGGIAFLLGPGMNMYRQSQDGRSFEFFGEDPRLCADMISHYVTGVLETGTIPTLKHFIGNESDWHRRTSDSVIDERTLHEVYMVPFQAGIDAGAMAVMTAYNQLNGEWCGQSNTVIHQLLRKDLGYKWLVMTDWWSVWDAKKIIKSGQDLEMPGDNFIKADAYRLLKEGKVTEAEIDGMAHNILRTCIAMGLMDRPVKDTYYLERYPEHAATALETAREAIVLLKSSDHMLPLRRDAKGTILLTGTFATEMARGGGSAQVEGYDNITMLDALKAVYGTRLEYVEVPTDDQIRTADAVLLSTGTRDTEGADRPFDLPAAEEKEAVRVTSLNPHTIVIVNSGGGVNMSAWNDKAAAVVYAWYPGQNGNRALAEILCGEVNPSGKLPISIERSFSDAPGYGTTMPPGSKFYTGWGPDNDMSQPIHKVVYHEGVFIGYRWYQEKGIKPLYAFGHGLSYTTFSYSNLSVTPDRLRTDGQVTVQFTVTNTGKSEGAEVAQLYVGQPKCPVPMPRMELKGFSRVMLAPGQSQVVTLRLLPSDLAYWDVASHGWKTAAGPVRVYVGGASDQISLEGGFTLK
ncbi:thermostable beta-glucosidase B [mine drainage metagenome]|uniref:Thermostable beta-glucosidase B n=1 Tax=mine drainage metagenome TaxID=410659 RepID=A0A1J5T2F4_9ZZZZ